MKDAAAVTVPGDRRAAGPRFAVLTRGGPLGRDWRSWYAGSDRQHAEHLHRMLAVATDTTTDVAWFALTPVGVQAAPGDGATGQGTPDDPRYAAIVPADHAGREASVISIHPDLRWAVESRRLLVEAIGVRGQVDLYALDRLPDPPDGPATAFARAAGEWPPPRPTWR